MDFRTEVNIRPSENRIAYTTGVLFMGSCFAENIGSVMKELRFPIEVNPFGVNYNPSSVARNLWTLMKAREYTAEDLHSYNDKWFSFDHHSRFSNPDRDACLENINNHIRGANRQLKEAKFLLLTWGTARVYVHKESANVVSNCHKLPAASFSRHLLTVTQIVDTYTKLFAALRKENPDLRVILTVSPVRHWKDGAEANSVSKASLLLAAYRLCEMFSYCDYFPAWEIAMDDLRDYRFYEDDLVHPNSQMISYIWEKFSGAWVSEESLVLSRRIRKLVDARKHRPFDPGSETHLEFCKKQLKETRKLAEDHPYLDLSELEEYFAAPLRGTG